MNTGLSNSSFLNGLSNFDDDFCNMDDLAEHETDFDKPIESASSATKRDTPIKRHALAAKQKGTVRNTRNVTPKKTDTKVINLNTSSAQ